MRYLLCLLIFFYFLVGCKKTTSPPPAEPVQIEEGEELSIDATKSRSIPEPVRDTSELEHILMAQGLIDMQALDPEIQTDIKYSTLDNFLNADVYGDFAQCYVQVEVGQKLAEAHRLVREAHPDLRLLLFDCVRPRSVQYQMWEIVKGTEQQKYVAAPGGGGSMHNYGAAIDLGLIHVDTGLVDMGTPFDYFGKLAQPRFEEQYLASGELSRPQVDNRLILRNAMRKAGFHMIMSEWWHFNAFERAVVREKYQIVE